MTEIASSNVINISSEIELPGPGFGTIHPGNYAILHTGNGTFHLYEISMVDGNPVEMANSHVWADFTEDFLASLDPGGTNITEVDAFFVPENIMTFSANATFDLNSGSQSFDVGSYLIIPRSIMDSEGNLLEGENFGHGTFMAVRVESDGDGGFLPPTAEAMSNAIVLDDQDVSGAALLTDQVAASASAEMEEDGLILPADSEDKIDVLETAVENSAAFSSETT